MDLWEMPVDQPQLQSQSQSPSSPLAENSNGSTQQSLQMDERMGQIQQQMAAMLQQMTAMQQQQLAGSRQAQDNNIWRELK